MKKGANFGGSRSFGNGAGYESAVMMNFRGQDKKQQTPGQLGQNPNMDQTDEYIVNLQQQIHFMELELKILREKVTEDEQKSGIGSLYDDDKTSHQHISLLKTKYAQMKRDFDQEMQQLGKKSLQVKGQEFVLDSQIKVLKEQIQKLKNQESEYKDQAREETGSLGQTTKDQNRQEMMLEGDLRTLNDGINSAETTHFEHKLHQDREVEFDKLGTNRHDLEVNLVTGLKEKKEKELAECKAALEQCAKDFLAKAEYQNALKETAELLNSIEEAKVKIQYLEIQVGLLSEQTEALNNRREDLTEEKKLADQKNEEYKTQFKAQEEIAKKRL